MADATDYWSCTHEQLLGRLGATSSGLSTEEAHRRRLSAPRAIGAKHNSTMHLFVRQFTNPIVLLLLIAAALSMLFADITDAAIIVAIVLASSILSFLQERGAVAALESLIGSVAIHADVLRNGKEETVLVADVVQGDIVVLRTGDLVPGDCRVLSANRLQVDEAPLTGENFPRRKEPGALPPDTELADRSNCLFFGTHVASGEGRAVVVRTGVETEFGEVTEHVTRQHLPTSFERGVKSFGFFLMRVTAVLVVALFLFNIATSRSVTESLLFSLALAVGLTPQMLPAIVTLSLSRGAAMMARQRVIVRRLDAIEDIGALDVLCTDKTGTLTVGSVGVHSAVDVEGHPSSEILQHATWNAALQRGFRNPIDDAVVAAAPEAPMPPLLGEIPFDFVRRRQSVIVETPEGALMVTKGAVEPLLDVCSHIHLGSNVVAKREGLATAMETYGSLSAEGLRVIGVATRLMENGNVPEVEVDMIFVGFLCFADPPKPGTRNDLARLHSLGVRVVLITGDNRLAATETARCVGIDVAQLCTGADIATLDREALVKTVESTHVFCEVDPLQKETIVRALSDAGHTVGFLGDGINDTPALHAADVGISVDNAVDVAKQTADLILLDKELSVLATGVEQGRRVFANTLKYVQVTTSANFGNMLSLALTTVFLPYLPLLPLQILLLNFLSDFPGLTIATDEVDPEQLARHSRWDIARVRRFMIVFGLASTIFDLLTFAVLRLVFDVGEVVLRSGWFALSTFTELAAMLVLRTKRPFFRSRPGTALMVSSMIVAGVTTWLPYSTFADTFGLGGLPMSVFFSLIGLVVGYVVLTELLKHLPWSRTAHVQA